MKTVFAHPKFLVVYSATVTAVFLFTVLFGLRRGLVWPVGVGAAATANHGNETFDQITVHRINVDEPDGTPRLVISDKAEFPGTFLHGLEYAGPDRATSAGFLFMNDEGTENGGLLFGGYRTKKGVYRSWGHLSFDQYEQDQAMALEASQDGSNETTAFEVNDNGPGLVTPAAMKAIQAAKSLPSGTAEKRKAMQELRENYGVIPRAELTRAANGSAALKLLDPHGRVRIRLEVARNGTPSMEFLDAKGKVTQRWPRNNRVEGSNP